MLHQRLGEIYGRPRPRRRIPPLDELVLTILSQNTSDTNRDRAWERLRLRYPSWEDVAVAPVAELEEALRPGGLHRVKARRIQEILAGLHERRGGYDLDHLADLDVAGARAELSGIKGLGDKSVNCILLFSLRLPAFPVDTHVFRVLQRIGIHRRRDLTGANRELQDAVSPEATFPFHMNVIRHGREVCHARRPHCWRCGVADLCGFQLKTEEPTAAPSPR